MEEEHADRVLSPELNRVVVWLLGVGVCVCASVCVVVHMSLCLSVRLSV